MNDHAVHVIGEMIFECKSLSRQDMAEFKIWDLSISHLN